jgi:tagatose 6-phosphate kinase
MTSPILVVSLNPALDVTHRLDTVDWAGVNRPQHITARPGGKGLNVAFTLRALGAAVRVVGLAGGAAGATVRDGASAGGVAAAFTPVSGETRRSFTVVDAGREQTAVFNEPGPQISAAEFAAFQADYAAELTSASVVVLTGSLPPGLAADSYAVLIAAAARAKVPAVLDTGGAALRLGANAGPEIIKPNLAELEQAAGRSLHAGAAPEAKAAGHLPADPTASPTADPTAGPAADLAAVEGAARHLLAAGARAAVVSLGPDGLLALIGPDCWHVAAPDVPVRNPTGAGDAVVAGLALGLALGWSWPDRLRQAAALGAATVASPVAGQFDRAEYDRLTASIPIPGLKGA